MTKQQEAQLPELMQNVLMSSEMEGISVSETVQAMCLSILRGERTLDDCLSSLLAQPVGN